jgi:hypothetical protein
VCRTTGRPDCTYDRGIDDRGDLMTAMLDRRRAMVMALAGVLIAATGCAADTVNGRGAASVASSGHPDFPSAGASTPAPSASVLPTPGGSGVLVTDEAGHFRVRMPSEPTRDTQKGSFAGYTFNVHTAIIQSPYVAGVEGEDISPALTASSYDTVLRSAVSSFGTSSTLTKVSESETTFQGHEGRIGIFERNGDRYEFLVFVYSGSQVYALFAPEGDKFQALADSFQPTI